MNLIDHNKEFLLLPDLTLYLDQNLQITAANQSAAKLGYQSQELSGKNFFELLAPGKNLQKTGNSGQFSAGQLSQLKEKNGRLALHAANGSKSDFEIIYFFPIDDEKQHVLVLREAIPATKTDTALQVSTENFRFLSSATEEGFLLLEGLKIIDANSMVCDFLGFAKKELLSKNALCFIQKSDRKKVLEMVRKKSREQVIIHSRHASKSSLPLELVLPDYTFEGNRHIIAVKNMENRNKLRLFDAQNRILESFFTMEYIEKMLHGEIKGQLSGEVSEASIIFFDLRDFTSLSEKLGALQIAGILNIIFSDIIDLVLHNKGGINKIIGDAILATFGLPLSQDNSARSALNCAIQIRDAVNSFNQFRPDILTSDLGFGMGITTGNVFSGNIGSYRRMEYTVVGDVVNTASRLQSLTKKCGGEILVDGNTLEKAGKQYYKYKKVLLKNGLRGKVQTIDIYLVEGFSGIDFDEPG